MDTLQRVSAAASFIVQSPPGEINDVISDLRTIVNDDEALQDGIQPALEKYNQEQFVCVTVPGQDYQVREPIHPFFLNPPLTPSRLSSAVQDCYLSLGGSSTQGQRRALFSTILR
jgi:hypothetical protein